ncbi:MAG: hypothetical protein GY801_16740 [bacterium]|nr:hypothetical protein [bacterium]
MKAKGAMDKDMLTKPTADEITEMADRGEEISQYFSNEGSMKYPARSYSETAAVTGETVRLAYHEIEPEGK